MLASRFWYVVLGLLLAGSVVSLYIAQSMFNRAGTKVLAEGLSSDSQVVSWYMRNASRERSGQLIKFALNPKIAKALSDSSRNETEVPRAARDAANSEVGKIIAKIPKGMALDAVFAVDKHGRVVGQHGYPQSTNDPRFELGGYPVVADALHGYIRDDTLNWDKLFVAVARPVEASAGGEPVGAVLGIVQINDNYARGIAERTGAAVAFYNNGERIASGAPEGFNRSQLDGIVGDFEGLQSDADYNEKGRSGLRYLTPSFGVVYAKLPGEAWKRGAGYAVGREAKTVGTPFGFFGLADDKDKAAPNILVVALILLVAVGVGIVFTVMEHTRPLNSFQALASELGAGKADQLQASKLAGVYRKIASHINDGIDHAAAKGGGSRRAADLTQVLGESEAAPSMSAFSFPEPSVGSAPGAAPTEAAAQKRLPKAPPVKSSLAATMPEAGMAELPKPAKADLPEPPTSASNGADQQDEWRKVFDDFVALKKQCGEPTESLTYAKFEGTLKKNSDAIMQKHSVRRVKFSVYEKEGKAALKANPIRD